MALPRHQRLSALLADSRKFQNEVSEKLAEQVLHALYELLRGFQAAHDASKGELLRQTLAERPDAVYRGLLTVILSPSSTNSASFPAFFTRRVPETRVVARGGE